MTLPGRVALSLAVALLVGTAGVVVEAQPPTMTWDPQPWQPTSPPSTGTPTATTPRPPVIDVQQEQP